MIDLAAWVPVGLAVIGLVTLLIGAGRALRRYRGRRLGRLIGVDLADRPGALYRSERWRLSGRPDEIRERPDGTLLPVETKSGAAPGRGPHPSHRIQVLAYCLLLEEATGRRPPFGVLRYGDGSEWSVPYDAAARRWLLEVRRALDRPYAGAAAPSRAKCAHCAFREICDRSVVGRR
ncbi:MAG: CRISPR-associated protein Cas4 [Thermoplasmata archaeon]